MYSYTSSYQKLYGKPSQPLGDRPSTLNLVSGSSSSAASNASAASKSTGYSKINIPPSQTNLQQLQPSKPSRYSSNLSTVGPISGKSSSYSNISNTPSYSSTYNQRPQQEVITTPPKSLHHYGSDISSSSSLYYPQQQQGLGNIRASQQQSNVSSYGEQTGLGSIPMSKSSRNLMESIPDVFCLSCPPAEFKFSDAYRAKTLPRTGKENERLIGFATLPEQVHRKSVKKGFDFTLMAVGESGLGKSTLINSLFLADFYQDRKIPSVADQVKKTTTIQKHSIEIEERGVKLRLTVVDTPGFGDALNCEESWRACVDHIDEQFRNYFQAESGLNRKHIQDTRIHCCLYFVPPYGHGLRQLDVEVLRNLQSRVNVIPIIAKSDILTPPEVRKLKDHILEDLRLNQIQTYQFPECDEEEDEEFKRQDRELKAAIPFAVTSSDTFVEVQGKKVRGRQYPWGIVEVENPSHSDFTKLRTMLIQSHMHDLKETTQDLHYENFRAKAIAQISQGAVREKERTKLKRDSSSEATDLLQQKEAEIMRMQQMISKMEARLKAANHSTTSNIRDSIIDL